MNGARASMIAASEGRTPARSIEVRARRAALSAESDPGFRQLAKGLRSFGVLRGNSIGINADRCRMGSTFPEDTLPIAKLKQDEIELTRKARPVFCFERNPTEVLTLPWSSADLRTSGCRARCHIRLQKVRS